MNSGLKSTCTMEHMAVVLLDNKLYSGKRSRRVVVEAYFHTKHHYILSLTLTLQRLQ